mgnify:CR=1 FL=1
MLFLVNFGLLISSAPADDLYLLKINNYNDLRAVNSVLTNAYGTFEGKFIVAPDTIQLASLKDAGLQLEMLTQNVDMQRVYSIQLMHISKDLMRVALNTLAVSGDQSLILADQSRAEQLRSEGYSVISMAGNRTPFFYVPPKIMQMPMQDFPTDSLADYVVQDSLYSYVHRLEEFKTRYAYGDSIGAARDWIYQKFLSFGYSEVRLDTFPANGTYLNNVFCIKPGINEPDKVIVVGGHYDSISDRALTLAPGADDNASGVSGVLELARVMKDVAFDKTIIFIAFNGEEVGLLGSYYFAQGLYNMGIDVEFMLNLDMISYNPDTIDDLSLYSGPFRGYADLCAAAAGRVAPSLVPIYAGTSQGSDHVPFVNHGYDVTFVIERNYQANPTYHQTSDLSVNMNYPYMTKIMRMAAAAVGQVQSMPAPVAIEDIRDIGDGQSLRVYWDNQCHPDYTYRIYYGTQSSVYSDSVDVPAGVCHYDLTGLIEGQQYFIGVKPINPDGHAALFFKESTGTSYVRPRIPSNFVASPDTGQIVLTWRANREIDFNHYQVLRRDSLSDWSVLADNITDTMFRDTSAPGQITFQYILLALDNDFNESDSTAVSSAVRATFNRGVLFVDETASGGLNPSDFLQSAFYDSIFDGYNYSQIGINAPTQKLSRSLAGQYSSVLWFDDDYAGHLLANSIDSLQWYLGFDANLFLAGWRTIYWVAGSVPLDPGNFVYDFLGINQVTENSPYDFDGAIGENGWPDVQISATGTFGAAMSNIGKFALRPGAQVIYRYHSLSGNPEFDGQPAGVLFVDGQSKRIALSFPIYYLTESSAHMLLAKVLETFGEGFAPQPYGDANMDGRVNLRDITLLMKYLYRGGPAPADQTYADANGDCILNLADVYYLINYCYRHGPAPIKGCLLVKE